MYSEAGKGEEERVARHEILAAGGEIIVVLTHALHSRERAYSVSAKLDTVVLAELLELLVEIAPVISTTLRFQRTLGLGSRSREEFGGVFKAESDREAGLLLLLIICEEGSSDHVELLKLVVYVFIEKRLALEGAESGEEGFLTGLFFCAEESTEFRRNFLVRGEYHEFIRFIAAIAGTAMRERED